MPDPNLRQALADALLNRWLKAANDDASIDLPVEGTCDAIAAWLTDGLPGFRVVPDPKPPPADLSWLKVG